MKEMCRQCNTASMQASYNLAFPQQEQKKFPLETYDNLKSAWSYWGKTV